MLEFFGHPFSSYTWKALIPIWEKGLQFDYRRLTPEHPDHGERLRALWPFGKFPVLVHDGRVIAEATVIIEYLDGLAPQSPMLSGDLIEVRLIDRVFDNYVMAPVMAVVGEHIHRKQALRGDVIAAAEAQLDQSYAWLDERLRGRDWAAGEAFGLADCAGAPSLFYADWVRPIPKHFEALRDYRAKVLKRPSVARAVEEARPYRSLFPLGAPDRD